MPKYKSYRLIAVNGLCEDIGVLGFVTQWDSGWRFMPNVAGRKASRKWHPTFDAAIPRWTGHPDRTRSELVAPKVTA